MTNAVLRAKAQRTQTDGTMEPSFHWSHELKHEICRRLIEGATTREICSDPDMPSRYQLFNELARDTAFATAYAEAKTEAPAALLDIAVDYATEATSSDSIDEMRKAEMYSRIISTYAEKLAPRKYGALLKVGGADELAPVAIEIVSYASQQAAEKDQQESGNRDE